MLPCSSASLKPLPIFGVLRVDVAEALHDLVLVRMDEDLAVAADQEGVAHAAEVQRVDDLHHRLQAEVAADHAERLAALARRAGDGQYQLVDGRLHVGFGEGGLAGAGGGVVPGRRRGS